MSKEAVLLFVSVDALLVSGGLLFWFRDTIDGSIWFIPLVAVFVVSFLWLLAFRALMQGEAHVPLEGALHAWRAARRRQLIILLIVVGVGCALLLYQGASKGELLLQSVS